MKKAYLIVLTLLLFVINYIFSSNFKLIVLRLSFTFSTLFYSHHIDARI